MQVFSEGDELYDAMLRDIGEARSAVRLESYLFADDEVGRPFVDLLCRKARQGVYVVVRVDTIGSLLRLGPGARRRMVRAGVRLHYGPPRPWRQLHRFNRRDHRKLLTVDDERAYLGGFNIHRECSRKAVGDRRWRDLHLRFGGPLAGEAVAAFDAYGNGRSDWEPGQHGPPLLLSNHGRGFRFQLYHALVRQLSRARRRLWLASPYFVPDRGFRRHLRQAALRGVDVRVLVPAHGDVPIVRSATRASVDMLLDAGVKVYEYLPRMQHAKAMLADDDWATVGTANFDYRSLFINDELNLVTCSPDISGAIAGWFEEGFRDSSVVAANRPKRTVLLESVIQAMAWSVRRWL